MEEVEDRKNLWSGLVHSYNSPVEHRFKWSWTRLLMVHYRTVTASMSKSGPCLLGMYTSVLISLFMLQWHGVSLPGNYMELVVIECLAISEAGHLQRVNVKLMEQMYI